MTKSRSEQLRDDLRACVVIASELAEIDERLEGVRNRNLETVKEIEEEQDATGS